MIEETNLPESLLNYWNTRPNIGIKHTSPESKVYKNSLAALATLLAGHFGVKYTPDQDWMADFGVIDKELHKPWSEAEIKQAMDRFDYMCSDAHVADKQYYPKNFPEFVWNPRTEKSFIMTLLGEYKDAPGQPVKPLDNDVVDDYHKVLMVKIIDDDMRQKFIKCVNYIVLQQRDWQDKYGQYFHSHELKDDGFYRYHRQYISLNYRDREDFRIDHLGAMTFTGFIVWLWEYHGITYKLSQGDVERAKARYARDQARIDENNRLAAERALERSEWLKSRVYRGGRNKDIDAGIDAV